MSADPNVRLRQATADDEAFILEMARHACIVEDWPLPDPDDEDVLSLLPAAGEVPTIAENHAGRPIGAVWTFRNDPPLLVMRTACRCPNCVSQSRPDGAAWALVVSYWTRCSSAAPPR